MKLEMQAQRCERCGKEDPLGWPDSRYNFWCVPCWQQYNESLVPSSSTATRRTRSGEGPERYEYLDPISDVEQHRTTEVLVMDQCCLDVARLLQRQQGSLCIVALGSDLFIPPPDAKKLEGAAFKELVARSTFQEAAFQDFLPVPRWGGLYASNVQVSKDDSGGRIDPFKVAVVYATNPWGLSGQAEDAGRFRTEMRDKILNILRICHKHGHEELVVTGTFSKVPLGEVAAIFREVLTQSSDAANVFLRVVFALPQVCSIKAFRAFQQEFRESFSLVPEGVYVLENLESGACLSVGGGRAGGGSSVRTTLADDDGEPLPSSSRWTLHQAEEEGDYTMQSVLVGEYLTVGHAAAEAGQAAEVQTANTPGCLDSRWRLHLTGGAEVQVGKPACLRSLGVCTLQSVGGGSYLSASEGGLHMSEDPEATSSQWRLRQPSESSASLLLGADGRIVLTSHPHLCLDAPLRHTGDENGTKVHLWEKVCNANRENQRWEHRPCGRIVLAAYPHLCLSAVNRWNSEKLHLWERVTGRNQDNQMWRAGPDGSIVLAAKPELCLSADEGDLVKGCSVLVKEIAADGAPRESNEGGEGLATDCRAERRTWQRPGQDGIDSELNSIAPPPTPPATSVAAEALAAARG